MRSLSKCNRLYSARKGIFSQNTFSIFRILKLLFEIPFKTQHHQFAFAQKDSAEISVRLVASIPVILIHAKMELPVHKLEVERMISNALASRVLLVGYVIEVFMINYYYLK